MYHMLHYGCCIWNNALSSLEKAMSILQLFTARNPETGVSAVAQQLVMPKSSVSRLMRAMERYGLLEQDQQSRRYRPGLLAFRLGGLYQAHTSLLDLADQVVSELVNRFGVTGYVSVMDGADVIVLRMRQGRHPVRFLSEPGSRELACSTAAGRALLARASEEEVRRILPKGLRDEDTKRKITADEIVHILHKVCRRGWAEAHYLSYPGISAVAVAVVPNDGQKPIALSLSFPDMAIDEARRDQMIADLVQRGARLGERFSDRYWIDRELGGRQPDEVTTAAQKTNVRGRKQKRATQRRNSQTREGQGD